MIISSEKCLHNNIDQSWKHKTRVDEERKIDRKFPKFALCRYRSDTTSKRVKWLIIKYKNIITDIDIG